MISHNHGWKFCTYVYDRFLTINQSVTQKLVGFILIENTYLVHYNQIYKNVSVYLLYTSFH
jgi:hypothetical protein